MAKLPIRRAKKCFNPNENGTHMVIPYGGVRYAITNNTALNEYPYYTEEITTLAYIKDGDIIWDNPRFAEEITGILKLVHQVKPIPTIKNGKRISVRIKEETIRNLHEAISLVLNPKEPDISEQSHPKI